MKSKEKITTPCRATSIAAIALIIIGIIWLTIGGEAQTVELGDNVTVSYVGKLVNDSVFGEGTIGLVVGEGYVVSGFENALIGMEAGENKTINVLPHDGYGEYNTSTRELLKRHMATNRTETLSYEWLLEKTEDSIEVGENITVRGFYWPVEIINVDEDDVLIKHQPRLNSIYYMVEYSWPLYVESMNDTDIVLRQEAIEGNRVMRWGTLGRILEVNDELILIDYNHPLAGEILVFDIQMVSIN